MDLDGSFAVSQLHTLYPTDVVEWLKRIGMPDPQLTDDMVSGREPRLDAGIALSNGDMFGHHQFSLNDPGWSLLIPHYLARVSPFEDEFLEAWKPGRRGSFNLNSNHDMYAWGKGYFEQALQHPSFSAQQGTSYFSVDFGDWIIVGLDTAYHDDSVLISSGAIGDDQKAFLRDIGKRVDRSRQKILLLTHHFPMSAEGTKTTGLLTEITGADALGKPPNVWYWGHLHNGVVYSSASALGTHTVARVMGHGGLPFAAPTGLEQHTGPGKPITCRANTPYGDDLPEHRGRVMNGFAVVTLTRDGGMSERFLNQDGSDMCG